MVELLSPKRPSCHTSTLRYKNPWRKIGSVNFLYWQYIYYFVLYLVSSLVFLVSGLGGERNVGYLNSLFLCISAGTGAGLNTVDLSTLNTFQQIILWLNIIMGSQTFVFLGLVIALRIKYKRRKAREEQRGTEALQTPIFAEHTGISSLGFSGEQSEFLYQRNIPNSSVRSPLRASGNKDAITEEVSSPRAAGRVSFNHEVAPTSALEHGHGHREGPKSKPFTYYEDVKEELELRYQAFSLLSWIVSLYIISIQLCGAIALGWFISVRHPSIPAENHVNAWWSGIFLCVSAFNNSGMSLINANMVPFQQSYFVLLVMSALILLGNTTFPILLCIIIRFLARVTPQNDRWQGWRDGLRLLINERSRILCPYLFTRSELFWLAGTVLVFNGIDWAAFGISVSGNPAFKNFSVITQVVDGLFQAFAIRSGGFGVVSIPSLDIGVQMTYVSMMYISSFPISPDNAWEAKSLGVCRQTKLEFLRLQISRTFSADDIWLLSVLVWLISVIETPHFKADPASYSIFNIVFEVVSAYGCVGVSMGYPDSSTSFSGVLRGGSQLILCIVMLLGRTREARMGVVKGDWGISTKFPGMEDEWEEREERA